MTEVLLWAILVLNALTIALAIFLSFRAIIGSNGAGKELREELQASREEGRRAGRELREEVAAGLRNIVDALNRSIEGMAAVQQKQLDAMTKELKELTELNQRTLEEIRATSDARIKELQSGNEKKLEAIRNEISVGLKGTSDTLSKSLDAMGGAQQTHLDGMTKQLKELVESNQGALDRIRAAFDTRIKELQEGNEKRLESMRSEISAGLKGTNDALSKTLEGMGGAQQTQLDGMTKQLKELTESNQGALDRIRAALDSRIKELQEGNEKKLEEMRKTVDEKLHDTLEKRLGESFKLVSDRLDAVHKGLGEMQNLATGVGDLKRVLTNVKARGTWAEVQLGAILEQILSPEQYEKNVCVKADSSERVEFAVRLPGLKDDPASSVWLPIDSKFPQEDYIRLQDAAERGDGQEVQCASDALARAIRIAGKDISAKYLSPPNTTDFAIMFLATEGLYAEVLRQPKLVSELQNQYRIVVAGPTTLAAILSSLRMGFQNIAVEQRAAEVWRVLSAIKTEFGKYGEILDRVKRQLNSATKTIDETGVRSRAIERKLRSVERLPDANVAEILGLSAPVNEAEEDEDSVESQLTYVAQ